MKSSLQMTTQLPSTFSPGQMTDFLMQNIFMNRISESLKDGFALTPRNLLKLVFLMSLSEMKGLVSSLMAWLMEQLKKTPALTLTLANSLSQKALLLKKKPEALPSPINPLIETSISIKVDLPFMCAFYRYLHENKNAAFIKTLVDIDIKNTKERIYKQRIREGLLRFEDVVVKTQSNIDYLVNDYNQQIIGVNSSITIISPDSVTSYLQLLTPEQASAVQKWFTISTPDVKELYRTAHQSQLPGFSEDTIIDLLLSVYPKLPKEETFIYVLLICKMFQYHYGGIMNMTKDTLQAIGKMGFDSFQNVYKVPTITSTNSANSVTINHNGFHGHEIFTGFATPSKAKEGDLSLDLCLSSKSAFSVESILQTMITDVYKYAKRNNNKIKVFTVSLQQEKNISERINPEYEAWEQKRDLLESLGKTDTKGVEGKINDFELKAFLSQPVPLKKIVDEKVTTKIVVKQINELMKDIDTLYLRKKDKQKLLASISQFRNEKETMAALGIPNKLNVLLYGQPGTGKSTTIQAVATYLQKDIYYVDLKDARSNEDLQLMFEYVNKNVPNGGCIVLEDIDTAVSCVLKRDLVSPGGSDGMTLAYFLNILQGTLTLDDSVFLVTTNHLNRLDEAFYRDGRFDVRIELKYCDRFQMNAIYEKILKRPVPEKLLERMPEDTFSPASLIYHVKDYLFLSLTPDEEVLEPYLKS